MLLVETLYYYDGPQCATFRDPDGGLWIGLAIGDIIGYKWPMMIARTDSEELTAVLNYLVNDAPYHGVTLRSAFVGKLTYLNDLDAEFDDMIPFVPSERELPMPEKNK